MASMTTEQAKALRAITAAVIEATKAAGTLGAPGGHLYAGMMAGGCSLSQFESIMSGLVRADMLTKSGECYRATAKGETFAGMVSA